MKQFTGLTILLLALLLSIAPAFGNSDAKKSSCPRVLKWSPSEFVRKKFSAFPDLTPFLDLDPSDIIVVDIQFIQINSRPYTEKRVEKGSPRYQWWENFLKEQFKDEPEMLSHFFDTEMIQYMEALYGPELKHILTTDAEILKPATQNLGYGVFGIKAPLKTVAAIVDHVKKLVVVPTSWKPRVHAYGVSAPDPTFAMNDETKNWLANADEINKEVMVKFKTAEDAAKTQKGLENLGLNPDKIEIVGERVPILTFEIVNKKFDTILHQTFPIETLYISNPALRVEGVRVDYSTHHWATEAGAQARKLTLHFKNYEDLQAAKAALANYDTLSEGAAIGVIGYLDITVTPAQLTDILKMKLKVSQVSEPLFGMDDLPF